MTTFCGLGEWRGIAEVYSGEGRFLGNGVDQRYAREMDDKRVRIDLSFIGPFKLSGHYVIADKGTPRLYQGPTNVGFGEAIGPDLIDSDNYWPSIGLSQRFFLMVLPGGDKLLSLALLSRGERLIYAVVGESDKVVAGAAGGSSSIPVQAPGFIDGASCDIGDDPAAGHGAIFLHRVGRWSGTLASSGGAGGVEGAPGPLQSVGQTSYEETVDTSGGRLHVRITGGGFAAEPARVELVTDGWQAWSNAGPMVGSYSLSGGRALSGVFHRLSDELRLWRREVVSHDGSLKAVVHTWYRGGVRIGVQYGVLRFEAA